MQLPNQSRDAYTHALLAICIGLVMLIVSTTLVWNGKIAGFHWVTAIAITGVICIAVSAMQRVQKLSIGTKSEIILAEVEKAKAEIFAKEKDLKVATLAILELFQFESSGAGRGHDEDSMKRRWEGIEERRQMIMKTLNIPDNDVKEFHAIAKYNVGSIFWSTWIIQLAEQPAAM
jgi:hypothetical protein